MWGRCVFDNIRKFLQFQLTVNVAALVIAGVSALFGLVPLTAVQLLWVNLIMDSFGALALATEPPTEALLKRPPKNVAHKKMSLISPEMWKMIIGQALFQVFVLLGGLIAYPIYANMNCLYITEIEISSVVFNSFIFCQLFNLISSRKVNKGEWNVLSGLFKNYIFVAILVGETLVQFILVGFTPDSYTPYSGDGFNCNCTGDFSFKNHQWQDKNVSAPCYLNVTFENLHTSEPKRLIKWFSFLGLIFETVPLGWQNWLVCIAIGFIGFLWGFILRMIPVPDEKQYKGDTEDLEDEEKGEEISLLSKA